MAHNGGSDNGTVSRLVIAVGGGAEFPLLPR
jgi:hypothetical protein